LLVGPHVAGNLPTIRRELIGRDADVADVRRNLVTAPLVTLTGAGGIGKTSLALAVGDAVAGEYPDRVWVCQFAEVSSPCVVVCFMAEGLSTRPQSVVSMSDVLARSLHGQHCLVILDNCEHVLDAVGALVAAIRAGAPTVRMLATSRASLGVA